MSRHCSLGGASTAPFALLLTLLAACYPVVPVSKTLVGPEEIRLAAFSRVVPGSRLRLFRDGAGTMDAYFASVRPDTVTVGIGNSLYSIALRYIDSAWVRTENVQTGMAIGSTIAGSLGAFSLAIVAGSMCDGCSVVPGLVLGGAMGIGVGAVVGGVGGAIAGGRWKPLFSMPATPRSGQ